MNGQSGHWPVPLIMSESRHIGTRVEDRVECQNSADRYQMLLRSRASLF